MGAQSNAAPVIIKRKKVVASDGHHGGAWKVAYADFVTAMMAFFMLMWLLNATTEKQRKGIADYFNPNVPINRISGGGDGMFGGDSVFSKDSLAKNGVGGMPAVNQLGSQSDQDNAQAEQTRQEEGFAQVEDYLVGSGGESLVAENALKHVVTKLTDEGLVIELFDLEELPLFLEDEDEPHLALLDLVRMVADAIKFVDNRIAVVGHLRSEPLVLAEKKVWTLSADRAVRVRKLLEANGVTQDRFDRITGHADRDLVASDPRSSRNNRIEIILLRSDRP